MLVKRKQEILFNNQRHAHPVILLTCDPAGLCVILKKITLLLCYVNLPPRNQSDCKLTDAEATCAALLVDTCNSTRNSLQTHIQSAQHQCPLSYTNVQAQNHATPKLTLLARPYRYTTKSRYPHAHSPNERIRARLDCLRHNRIRDMARLHSRSDHLDASLDDRLEGWPALRLQEHRVSKDSFP